MKDSDLAAWQRRVGRVIVELRTVRNLTQEELAADVGRSTAALSRWETGKAGPTLWDAHRLASVLGAPADLLVNPPEIPGRVSPLSEYLALEASQSGVQEGLRRVRPLRAAEDPQPLQPSRRRSPRGSGAGRG